MRLLTFVALISLPLSVFSQEISLPKSSPLFFGINISGSPSADKQSETDVIGADVGIGYFLGATSVAAMLDVGVQRQDIDREDIKRYAIGLGLNYYFELASWNDRFKPFVGVRHVFYRGRGKTGDALDCLTCSDMQETYKGGEDFASLGAVIGRFFLIRVDLRLSDNRSDFRSAAYDPFGVGDRYDYSTKGIPDPKILFSVGLLAMRH